jgi:hypothetical protein
MPPAGEEEEEEDEGPESPDSPESSPSTAGAGSSSDDSDSSDDEDEEEKKEEAKAQPSPAASGSVSAPSSTQPALPTNRPGASSSAPVPSLGNNSTTSAAARVSSRQPVAQPVFTLSFSSQGNAAAAPQITQITVTSRGNFAAVPQITETSLSLQGSAAASQITQTSSPTTSTPSSSTPTTTQDASADSETTAAAAVPPNPARPEGAGQDSSPQRSSPQEERTMITKGGAAAAITLSIIGMLSFVLYIYTLSDHRTGALAIVIAAVVFLKRRKRRQNNFNQRLPDDDVFHRNNTGSLHAPETIHVANEKPFFAGGGGSHLTRSTERSESLFGAGPYVRPETVSTERNKSRFPVAPPQPTPNPFADPPLNKAYDVLAGRPRSTTLTDRGSWVKNPFHNPESERFDPFGELQEKARAERRRYVEEAKKEAELAREKEVARQFGEKEKMGLGMPDEMRRKGSGVTLEGMGVLDRSGGAYRDV